MLELLPCPNTKCVLLRSVHAAMLSAYVCANGAIATGTVIVATRYFQESSNRILVAENRSRTCCFWLMRPASKPFLSSAIDCMVVKPISSLTLSSCFVVLCEHCCSGHISSAESP